MHIGGIEQEVREIRALIQRKPDDHQIHEINRRLDGLECTLRELRTEVDGLRSRQQEMDAWIVGQQ